MLASALGLVLLAGAQDPRPGEAEVLFRIDCGPRLVEAARGLRVAGLLEHETVGPALLGAGALLGEMIRRDTELYAMAAELGVQLSGGADPFVESVPLPVAPTDLFDGRLDRIDAIAYPDSAELLLFLHPGEDRERFRAMIARTRTRLSVEYGAARRDGPVTVFGDRAWLVDKGDLLVVGIADLARAAGDLAPPEIPLPDRLSGRGPGLLVHMDGHGLSRAIALVLPGDGDLVDQLLDHLGIHDESEVCYAIEVDGDGIRDTLFIGLPRGPGGLMAALTRDSGDPPELPMPEPCLWRARWSGDPVALLGLVQGAAAAMGEALPWSNADRTEAAASFGGGISVAVSAPSPGTLIPRLGLGLELDDAERAAQLVTRLLGDVDARRRQEGEDSWWTLGSGVCYSFVDRALYVAESEATLREILEGHRAGAPGRPSFDVGADPLPGDLDGAVIEAFDLVGIYRAIAEQYLPMLAPLLSVNAELGEPLLGFDGVPSAEDMTPFLGAGRSAYAVEPQGIWIGSAGPLGSSALTLQAMVFGALAAVTPFDTSSDLEARIARAQAERVGEALAAYREAHGAPAPSLEALVDAGALDPRSLVSGSTPKLVLQTESGEVPSSFRYVAAGLRVPRSALQDARRQPFIFDLFGAGTQVTLVLVETGPTTRGGRIVLTEDGKTYTLSEEAWREHIEGR